MRRFLNYIGSRRFAIYLLAVTTMLILLSNLLPKPAFMGKTEVERLKRERPLLYALSVKGGIQGLARSPYFQVIPAFIFLSVTVCTLRRLRAELDRREREPLPRELSISHTVTLPAGGTNSEGVDSVLRRGGWRVLTMDGVLYGRKGERGIWGSIGFHFGMDVALIGILVSAATGLDGRVMLTEGFPVDMPKDIKGVRKTDVPDFPLREMTLESFTPVFEEGFPVLYESKLVAVDRYERLKSYTLGVNRPLDLEGYKFIFTKAGYSPRFRLSKKDGFSIDTVANLLISMPGEIDYFDIQGSGIRMRVEMFPDFYEEDGVPKTRGKVPVNPVLFVEMERGGKMLGRGFLHKGKAVSFDDYTLEFVELRHWAELVVSRDNGVPIIIVGFVLIAGGLCVRFILNERHLWIIMNEAEGILMLKVGGRARFFPALFEEELRRLVEEIEEQVKVEV